MPDFRPRLPLDGQEGTVRGDQLQSEEIGLERSELLREAYERFNEAGLGFDPERDAPRFWAALADDIEVHEPDDVPEPRVFVGREGYRAATREACEGFDELRYALRWILEVGDHLMAVVHGSGRERDSGSGRELHEIHLWTVRDGKFARVKGFHSADEALREVERLDGRA
jgi:ketosteroid isomerase-like protein